MQVAIAIVKHLWMQWGWFSKGVKHIHFAKEFSLSLVNVVENLKKMVTCLHMIGWSQTKEKFPCKVIIHSAKWAAHESPGFIHASLQHFLVQFYVPAASGGVVQF